MGPEQLMSFYTATTTLVIAVLFFIISWRKSKILRDKANSGPSISIDSFGGVSVEADDEDDEQERRCDVHVPVLHYYCPRYQELIAIIVAAKAYKKKVTLNTHVNCPRHQMQEAETELRFLFSHIRTYYVKALDVNGITPLHPEFNDYVSLYSMFEYMCTEKLLDKFRVHFLQHKLHKFTPEQLNSYKNNIIPNFKTDIQNLIDTYYPYRLLERVCLSRPSVFTDRQVIKAFSQSISKILTTAREIAIEFDELNKAEDAEFKKIMCSITGAPEDDKLNMEVTK